MADQAHEETDKKLEKLEKKITKEYKQAANEVQKKFEDFMDRFAKKYSIKVKAMNEGLITIDELNTWLKGQVMIKKRWEEMANTLAEDLVNSDKIAMSMVGDHMPEVYALNHNYGTYEAEKGSLIDTSYTLYDRQTVERLIRDNPNLLPKPKVDIPKDMKWNKQKLTSAITQGILQGESISDISKRLRAVTDMDRKSAIRNARTMTTSAENAGRSDSYARAKNMGINLTQIWMATLDNRTRHSHRMMDGERLPQGKGKKEPKFSNGCRYPADPNGPPSEVYNCRCTLIAQVEGVDYNLADVNQRNSRLGSMPYEEWVETKAVSKHYNESVKAYNERYIAMREKQFATVKGLQELYRARKAAVDNFKLKSYNNIWKSPVTEKDYEDKKEAIQKKLDYFNEQLLKSTTKAEQEKWESLIESTNEFKRKGEHYSLLRQRAESVRQALSGLEKLAPPRKDSAEGAYSQQRKDKAKWFDNSGRGKMYSDAREYFTPPCSKLLDNATQDEFRAFYAYTSGSGGFNRPLAGFEAPRYSGGYGWDLQYFKGSGNVDLNNEGQGANIRNLTNLISRSTYPDDVWLQTGQDNRSVESFLGIPYGALDKMSQNELDGLIGRDVNIPQFLSCGFDKGGGFSNKPCIMNVYCPSGSQMFTVDERGAYNDLEHETILQRGGYYRVTKIEKTRGRVYVDVELHYEEGYNLFGQEE